MAASVAKVKAVLSGDTLVLKSTKSGAEKTLSLAYVSAPKLRREGDEPHAFASRDYLRKLIVGKEITFKVLYNVQQINREYGAVYLSNGQNLAELLVSDGIVRVRDDAGKRETEGSEAEMMIQKLRIYEDQARTAGRGVWDPKDDGKVDVSYEAPISAKAFLEEHKGKTIDAVVERVISGDRLAVRLLLTPKKHQQLVLLLAGVRCPVSARTDPQGTIQPAEEYGFEAKEFVELRLLQRTVKVNLLGTTQTGQVIGTILHPAGNIAEFILLEGYGRCVDNHSTMIGSDMVHYRKAEQKAKDDQKRVWKGHVKQKRDASGVEAVVSRVTNAEIIYVRNKAGQEKKVSLSSIRQPKPSDPTQSLFSAEAKEFLRKKLIGKHVRVTIDGKRPAQDGFEEKEMATVIANGQNVALMLVEAGYASVVRHRHDDQDRSPIWDQLVAAEEQARKEQKGMWSPKPPQQAGKMVEASETIQKAKGYLSFLQRQKRVPAVVDYVSSGSRFKVIIPKENARLTFVLGGIRAPRTARNENEKSEPFGEEAYDWAVKRCWQRDVEIDVEDIDRVGGFIGTMYINRENVAKGLLEEGLASVHAYSAEKSGHANELFGAENRAKAAKKGMWHDYDPEAEAAAAASAFDNATEPTSTSTSFERRKDYRDVAVTNVDTTTGTLKIQIVGGSTTGALESLMSEFRKLHVSATPPSSLEGPPKAGQYVSALFSEDRTFYRARVKHVDRAAGTAEVLYIDYGNAEKLPWKSLRVLPDQYGPNRLSGQAKDAKLSFLQFPPTEEYMMDTHSFLCQNIENRNLVANIDREDGNELFVTLWDPKSGGGSGIMGSINAELVQEGLARVVRKKRGARKCWEDVYEEELEALRGLEEGAMENHRGMWEYGDPFADDE